MYTIQIYTNTVIIIPRFRVFQKKGFLNPYIKHTSLSAPFPLLPKRQTDGRTDRNTNQVLSVSMKEVTGSLIYIG